MSEKVGILERTKMFALRIIRLYSSLPKTTEAQVIGKQLCVPEHPWAHRFAKGIGVGRMRR